MKKILLLAVAALATCLVGTPVLALDGPHNTVDTVAGSCKLCHIPHSAAGERLWVEAFAGTTGSPWSDNKIGQLCYSCHDGSQGGSNMDGYIYGTSTSHSCFYSAVPYEADMTTTGTARLNASGLPYTSASNPILQGGATAIQCTSCHTVHTYTGATEGRPYLRNANASRGDNCETCHGRGLATGNGAKGAANSFAGVLGSALLQSYHPVDISATVASEGAALVATSTLMTQDIGTIGAGGASVYNLGGKLAAGTSGNMDCGTCHAVHGDEVAATQANGNFKLAIENYPASYVTSPLCAGCHTAGVATPVVTGCSDHPIDSNSGSYTVTYPATGGPQQGAAADPWPAGASTNAEGVCSSSHDIHGGMPADAADLTQGNTLVGRLRRGMGRNTVDWCYSCHLNASPANHHSHTGNLNIAQGDPMTSILTCGDCHGGTGGSTAHNGTGGFFATQDFGSGNHASNDYWCQHCHAVNPTTILAPVALGPATTIVAPGFVSLHTDGTTPITPAANGVDKGESTHILGDDGAMANTAVWTAVWPNADNTTFTGSIDGQADNLSRWGATANAVVCESCHNIIGNVGWDDGVTGNEGWACNLLLEAYNDDGIGNKAGTVGGTVGVTLCINCHAGGTIPAGTHQTTGMTITAAADNLRTPSTLITALTGYANATGAPNNASYPNTDFMDCDSCHRPHDAATGGISVATTMDETGAGASGDDYILEVCGAGFVYTPALCAECHAY